MHYEPYFSADNKKRMENATREGAVLAYVVAFNRVESGYLIASMLTLMAGMVFQSGYVDVSSKTYIFLTVVVRRRCCGRGPASFTPPTVPARLRRLV